MTNVLDAMKKHEAELADDTQSAPPAPRIERSPSPAPNRPDPMPPIVTEEPDNDGYSLVLKAHHDRGGTITEEYRALRTSLLAQCPDERFCYLVTSANAKEGKTVTCLNLAVVMAERMDRRTLVVDGDLRKGRMSALLDVPSFSPGLAELLRGQATAADVTHSTVYPNLLFIPAGRSKLEEVGHLLGQPTLADTVQEFRRQYDYIVFDTPPINLMSDAGMLGRAVGEALIVVRMNKTRRESVDRAIGLLHAANVKLAGVVLTHQKYFIPNYLYRYA